MQEQIRKLVKLQSYDSKIIEIEDERIRLPREVDAEKLIYEDVQSQISGLEEEKKGLQVKGKDKEIELESKEAQIKKLQSQLYQVKKNDEYRALENEISSTRADSSLVEEEILDILDEIDKVDAAVEEKKNDLRVKKELLDKRMIEVSNKMVELDKEYESLKNERGRIASTIEKPVLSRYEKILQNKRGQRAIVAAKDSACQGCFMNLRPQLIHEVKLGKNLIVCENCSRILYIEE